MAKYLAVYYAGSTRKERIFYSKEPSIQKAKEAILPVLTGTSKLPILIEKVIRLNHKPRKELG